MQQRLKLSRGVDDLLRDKWVPLNSVTENNLQSITKHLYGEGLIGKDLHKKVVKGITGVTISELSAEVAFAVSDYLESYPEQFPKYVNVLEQFDSVLAKKMKQEFEGELTCYEQKLFIAVWHSYTLLKRRYSLFMLFC